MGATFEADDVQIAALLEELAAITVYAMDLHEQVSNRATGVAAGWDGQASTAFTAQINRWQVEEQAMAAEVEHFTNWVANAKHQYAAASDAIKQGWV
ncbi:uncharacterized protein YukE [Psychromicrobium silvestre]|uniref:Uncharacterized protein YukE n=1 Tax=Psychromicrobium silvestre TaxID=1645614 RepID=A0A7Y9LSX7_9MICC|nr:hypothetical protein [Psychromicrobium silvestre]NYE95003.1 uncharacterized protein YukE [Psychromicrobium silvestre]